MRTLVYLVSLLLALSTTVISDDQPNTKGIISLINAGFGHACPCDGTVYTAGHVVEPIHKGDPPRAFLWEDSYGNKGKAEAKAYDDYRDLGTLNLKGDKPVYFVRASAIPKEGDKVYWEEYGDKDYLPKVQDAKIMYDRAGYIFFDKLPTHGASGSCLLNAAGEAVGVVVWGFVKGTKKFGAATLIIE